MYARDSTQLVLYERAAWSRADSSVPGCCKQAAVAREKCLSAVEKTRFHS